MKNRITLAAAAALALACTFHADSTLANDAPGAPPPPSIDGSTPLPPPTRIERICIADFCFFIPRDTSVPRPRQN